jgi:hypothetical protein
MATGNHFWLDVVAGVVVAAIALILVYRNRSAAAGRQPQPLNGADPPPADGAEVSARGGC